MKTTTGRLIDRTARNARFWTFENGAWVKLTLKPGQVLTWGKTSRDCEGHSFERNQWTHTGAGVLNDWHRGGRDCDGFTEESGACFAAADELAAVPVLTDDDGAYVSDYCGGRAMLRPEWRKVGENRCRDEYAEAAGY